MSDFDVPISAAEMPLAVQSFLLAVHLAIVLTLFVMLPYSRFVHGVCRFAALVRHAREMQTSLT